MGPDAVGGAEQVLSALDRALVAAGHRSVVVACRGSTAAGRLVETPVDPLAPVDPRMRQDAVGAVREQVAAEVAAGRVDLVHMHGLDFAEALPPAGVPVLVTLHLPLDWYGTEALRPARPRTFLHGVSWAQQRGWDRLPLLGPIGNGVEAARLGGLHLPRTGAAMLGRVCPEKGQHLALRAAHRAGVALTVAGTVFPYPAHRAYYAAEVAPLLDGRRRFVGALGFAAKRRLLSGVACLLVPSLAAETSSLVAMEALACGTPVVAFAAGALPEIVEDGRTGFVVEDEAGMAAAIGRVGGIDPEACRAAARARFGIERMAGAYLDRYARLAGGEAGA